MVPRPNSPCRGQRKGELAHVARGAAIVAALACCSPVLADSCTAYYFKNGVVLYEDAGLSAASYRKTGPSIAIPQSTCWGVNSRTKFTVRNDCRGTFCGTCSGAKGVIMAIAFKTTEKCWGKGYIDLRDGQPFRYSPKLFVGGGNSYEMDFSGLLEALAYFVDKEKAARFEKPQIHNEELFHGDYTTVWQAVIQAMAEQSIPIKTIDKSSGLVISEKMTDERDGLAECPFSITSAHQVSFNVFVKTVDDSVSVRINTTMTALRQNETVKCYSKGTIEQFFFDRIAEALH